MTQPPRGGCLRVRLCVCGGKTCMSLLFSKHLLLLLVLPVLSDKLFRLASSSSSFSSSSSSGIKSSETKKQPMIGSSPSSRPRFSLPALITCPSSFQNMEDDEQPMLKMMSTSQKDDKHDADHEQTCNEQQHYTSGNLVASTQNMTIEDEPIASSIMVEDHGSKSLVLLDCPQQVDGATSASPACSNLSFAPGSLNREIVLAKLNQDKVLSLIKAWEDNVKAKSINRLGKKLAKISAWEKARKARAEAQLQELEEKIEKRRASFVENVKNEIAALHKRSEEERALAESKHGEEILKAEEMAAKYRASGKLPAKYGMWFGI